MTRQEIRDRILLALNESPTAPVFFSLGEVDDIIDEAAEIISEEVTQIRRTAYLPRRRGVSWYNIFDFAPDLMTIYRVWLPDDETRLEYISMRRLDALRQKWMQVSSDSPDFWYSVSWDTMGIYPTPTTGEDFLRVDYLAWPPEMVDDNDEPEFDEEIQDAMVLYGVYDGLMKHWDITRALDYFGQFVDMFTDKAYATTVRRFSRGVNWRESVAGYEPDRFRSIP